MSDLEINNRKTVGVEYLSTWKNYISFINLGFPKLVCSHSSLFHVILNHSRKVLQIIISKILINVGNSPHLLFCVSFTLETKKEKKRKEEVLSQSQYYPLAPTIDPLSFQSKQLLLSSPPHPFHLQSLSIGSFF